MADETHETHVVTKTTFTQANTRPWTTPLTGCFEDVKGCICGLLCMPCTMCSISKRVGEFMCVPFCVPGGIIALRTKIRVMFGIEGSICNDCISMTCCGPCAVCQMDRELNQMGK